MLGLMMDTPLLTTDALRYAATAHGETEIVSRNVDGSIHRYCYSAAMERCLRLSAALQSLEQSKGDLVGSLARNTHHNFELFYGVTGTFFMLHYFKPHSLTSSLVHIHIH